MTTFSFTNFGRSTLAVQLNPSTPGAADTLNIQSADIADFPGSGKSFVIRIENEFLDCTGSGTASIPCTRGAEGSSAAVTHTVGTPLAEVVSAAELADFVQNPMTTQDDVIVGGASGFPSRLGKGSNGQVLTVDPITGHIAWDTPAFVNPLTTQDDIIIGGSSGTPARLPKGSNGQVLTVNSSSGHLDWETPSGGFTNPMTNQDDLIIGNVGGSPIRLGKGSSGQVLTVDASTGHLTWETPSSGGMTNPMTTANDVIIGGSGGTPTRLAHGLHGEVLTYDGGSSALVWGPSNTGIALDGTVLTKNSGAAGGVSWTQPNPMTTQDDIIVAGAGGQPTRLAKGADGQVLTVDPTTHHVVWDNSASGFSNPMTTQDDIIVGGSAGVAARLPKGSNGQVLTVNGSGHLDWETPTSGGMTNPMTTSGDVIYGGSSGTPTRLAVGATNQVLTVVGGVPTWQNASSGFSNPMTTQDDLIVAGSGGTATRFAKGASGQILTVDPISGHLAWDSPIPQQTGIYEVSGYAVEILKDAPIVYYRLDERSGTTAYDYSGNNYNGTYNVSNATLQAQGAVNDGDYAVSASGISMEAPATQLPLNTADRTMEGWFRSTQSPVGFNFPCLFGYGAGDDGHGAWPSGTAAGNDFIIDFADVNTIELNTQLAGTTLIVTLPNGGAMNDGLWHHVAVTYKSSTKVLTLYYDGVQIGTRTCSTDLTTLLGSFGNHFCLGDRNDGVGHDYSGDIDEVAVYPTVLSAARIAAHYAAASGEVSASTSATFPSILGYRQAVLSLDKPIIYWAFDETAVGTAADATGGGNTLNTAPSSHNDVAGVTGSVPDSLGLYTPNGGFGFSAFVSGSLSNIPLTGNRSFTFWAKSDTGNAGNDKVLWQYGSSGAVAFWITSDGKSAKVTIGGTTYTISNVSATSMFDGAWHHYGLVLDTNVIRVYADGVLKGSNGHPPPTTSGTTFTIGLFINSYPENWSGSLDEFGIFNYALSSAQVAGQYANRNNATGMQNPMTALGDIIYASDTIGTAARLAIGSSAQVLQVTGGIPVWGAAPSTFSTPLLVSGVDASPYKTAVLADSPVAYYRLDETSGTTAADSSGHSRNGTYANSPTYSVAGPLTDGDTAIGVVSGAEIMSVTTQTGWPTGAAARTYECWIKGSATSNQIVWSHGGGGSAGNTCALQLAGSTTCSLQTWSGQTDWTVTTNLGDNAWHHVVFTYDGASTWTLYIDGVSQGTHSFTPSTGTAGLWLGDLHGFGQGYTGSIDEWAVYSSALSATRVAAHYAAAATLTAPQTWKNHSGTTVATLDQTGLLTLAGGITPASLVPGGSPTNNQVLTWQTGGVLAWTTPSGSGMSNPMTTQDDIIIGGSSGTPARLPKGSNGQVLTVNGSGHLDWETPSGGGGGGGSAAASPYNYYVVPAFSNWSWVNQGSSTGGDDAAHGVYLDIPAVSGANMRILEKSTPSSPYTIEMGFSIDVASNTEPQVGLFLRESSSGKLVFAGYHNSGTPEFTIQEWSSATAWNATYTSTPIPTPTKELWVRVQDDGTNRIISFSYDGIRYIQMSSVTRTDYITPDQIGFGGQSNSSTLPVRIRLISYNDGVQGLLATTAGSIYPAPTAPPTLASWTKVNQGSSVMADTNTGLVISGALNDGGFNFRSLAVAKPGSTYTVTAGFIMDLDGANYNNAGLMVRDSASGKIVALELIYESHFIFRIDQMSSNTAVSTTVMELTGMGASDRNGIIYMKVVDDATHRTWYYSVDNDVWHQLYQETSNTYATPDQVGFFLNSWTNQYSSVKLFSWTATSP